MRISICCFIISKSISQEINPVIKSIFSVFIHSMPNSVQSVLNGKCVANKDNRICHIIEIKTTINHIDTLFLPLNTYSSGFNTIYGIYDKILHAKFDSYVVHDRCWGLDWKTILNEQSIRFWNDGKKTICCFEGQCQNEFPTSFDPLKQRDDHERLDILLLTLLSLRFFFREMRVYKIKSKRCRFTWTTIIENHNCALRTSMVGSRSRAQKFRDGKPIIYIMSCKKAVTFSNYTRILK